MSATTLSPYTVISQGGITVVDRFYPKWATIYLVPAQAKYLLAGGLIVPGFPGLIEPSPPDGPVLDSNALLELSVDGRTRTIPIGQLTELIDLRGEPGPPGPAGNEYIHTQSSPSRTWTIVHNFGREPDVAVYVDGRKIETSVASTGQVTVVTFFKPQSGRAILT